VDVFYCGKVNAIVFIIILRVIRLLQYPDIENCKMIYPLTYVKIYELKLYRRKDK